MSQDLLGATREPGEPERPVAPPPPPPMPLVAHPHGKATRNQRIALLASLIVSLTGWIGSWFIGPQGKYEVYVHRRR